MHALVPFSSKLPICKQAGLGRGCWRGRYHRRLLPVAHFAGVLRFWIQPYDKPPPRAKRTGLNFRRPSILTFNFNLGRSGVANRQDAKSAKVT